MSNHLKDFSDQTTKNTQQQINRNLLKSLFSTIQKLNIKASFTSILVYAAKRNVLNRNQHLFICFLMYLADLFFIFSYSTYHWKLSWSNTVTQTKKKVWTHLLHSSPLNNKKEQRILWVKFKYQYLNFSEAICASVIKRKKRGLY